ncbi:hypothetical protein BJP44_09815 [Candidatus Williamhamiltonella defendens]|nr:hypothetical protein BJP44_09815 [Candidatus Hamiltonella defensa]
MAGTTTHTFALNTELRPLLEATAAQKGTPLWVELIPFGEQITGRDGRSWVNDHPQGGVDAFQANQADLPIDIEHATELKAPRAIPPLQWVGLKGWKCVMGGLSGDGLNGTLKAVRSWRRNLTGIYPRYSPSTRTQNVSCNCIRRV